MSESGITFSLNLPEAAATLIYRPWGVRTLKLRMNSTENHPPLWLRFDRPVAESGLIWALCDDSDAFMVSWGGGHEDGPPVMVQDILMALETAAPLPAHHTNTVYFNVRHVGPGLPERARLTLKAFTADGTAAATLVIHLRRPARVPSSVMQLVPTSSTGSAWQTQPGAEIALYDSRWWPQRDVSYAPVPRHWPRVPLIIRRVGSDLRFYWHSSTEPVAIITDQTTPSVFDQPGAISFECFAFNQGNSPAAYLAVRAMFFWLDTRLGFRALGLLGRHEVPDAERFDLLFRISDGRVLLACTDLHWREMWGQAVAAPLQATLGLNRQQQLDLAREKLGKQNVDDTRPRYNPLGYVRRLAARLVSDEDMLVKRAKGTQAHVPTLNRVVQVAGNELDTMTQGMRTVHDMTSTDVRLG